ncbi:calcium/proton exchanger [Neosynechococcus sphagnicola]|nr:calcium/proton exchanger [Neosynechococcus sphagnicola]
MASTLMKPNINWLIIFLPISFAIAYIPYFKNEIYLFFTSCLGLIIVAYWLGNATEQLAARVGSTWGGMMNAAFSNLPELIFGLIAVSKGLESLAKATWTGAIISNMLVVVGAAIMAGGYRYGIVKFPLERAKDAAAGLMLATFAVLLPSVYAHFVAFGSDVEARQVLEGVSIWTCLFLLMAYGGSIVYALAQFRVEITTPEWHHLDTPMPEKVQPDWSLSQSMGVLAISSLLIAFLSDFISDSIDSITASLGWTQMFVGIIVIGVIGNVGALFSAVSVALKNKMDLSFEIGLNAASQVALLVVPVLVLSSVVMGKPVSLLFTPAEIAALLSSVLIMAQISQDGRCNWLNGLQMLILYGIIGVLFFYDHLST